MTNEQKPELAACLHCGSKDAKALLIGGLLKVLCPTCKASTGLYNTKAEAIAAWNRRYVCPDKNGEPVYAGDKVKAFIRSTERDPGDPEYDTGTLWWDGKDLLWRLAITGDKHTKKRFCAFYYEIELIKEPT